MATSTAHSLTDLYMEDETAWLEEMAGLVQDRDLEAIDWDHLSEYLTDMAISERREVRSRLKALLMHLLKWEFQPAKRSRSWRTTILDQQDELVHCAGSGVLRNHAESVLPKAYASAVKLAVSETGLPRTSFPVSCPYTIDELFAMDFSEDEGS